MMTDQVENKDVKIICGNVFLRPDNIICVNLKDDYQIDLPDMIEINNAIEKIANGKKHGVLTVGGKYTSFSQDVIKNSNLPENFTYTIADAFVIISMHQRLLANFYIQVIKPPVPTKYFENTEDAIKWLYTFK